MFILRAFWAAFSPVPLLFLMVIFKLFVEVVGCFVCKGPLRGIAVDDFRLRALLADVILGSRTLYFSLAFNGPLWIASNFNSFNSSAFYSFLPLFKLPLFGEFEKVFKIFNGPSCRLAYLYNLRINITESRSDWALWGSVVCWEDLGGQSSLWYLLLWVLQYVTYELVLGKFVRIF